MLQKRELATEKVIHTTTQTIKVYRRSDSLADQKTPSNLPTIEIVNTDSDDNRKTKTAAGRTRMKDILKVDPDSDQPINIVLNSAESSRYATFSSTIISGPKGKDLFNAA